MRVGESDFHFLISDFGQSSEETDENGLYGLRMLEGIRVERKITVFERGWKYFESWASLEKRDLRSESVSMSLRLVF